MNWFGVFHENRNTSAQWFVFGFCFHFIDRHTHTTTPHLEKEKHNTDLSSVHQICSIHIKFEMVAMKCTKFCLPFAWEIFSILIKTQHYIAMKNATCSTQTISIEIERYQIENCIAQNCKRCTNILCFFLLVWKENLRKPNADEEGEGRKKEKMRSLLKRVSIQIDGKNQMKRKEERNITRSKHIQYVYIISEFIKWKWFQSTVEWLSFF